MPDRPLRKTPKVSIQLYIDLGVLESVLPLMKTNASTHLSTSALIERIVFLSEHMYIEERNNRFMLGLIDLKAARLKENLEQPKQPKRYIHATIDEEALAFVDLLLSKYDDIFKNRSDVVELLLHNIGMNCTDVKRQLYYSARLEEAQNLRPRRSL